MEHMAEFIDYFKLILGSRIPKTFQIIWFIFLVSYVSTGRAIADNFVVPTSGTKLTYCEYGDTTCATSNYHTGQDYDDNSSLNIQASNRGKVVHKEIMWYSGPGVSDHGMGTNLIIEHVLDDDSKIYTSYSHLASVQSGIDVGSCVNRGEVIATMGGSGYGDPNYWGRHLHFEFKFSAVTGSPWGGSYWGYTPSYPDNYGYVNPYSYIGLKNAKAHPDCSGGVSVYEFWRRADPIIASNQSGQNNFDAQYKILNNNSSSITVDDMAIAILKDGSYLFDCWRKNSSTSISGNSNYQTGIHYCEIYNSGNYSTEARLKINGQWQTYDSQSFIVHEKQNVTVYDFWRQADPIYASNQNGEDNFEAQFKIQNNNSSSITIDDMAIHVLKDGENLFDCWRKNSSTTISGNSNYATGRHFCEIYNSGSYSTEARLMINGQWNTYESLSFTVLDQPSSFPDLVVESPSVDDNTLSPGEKFQIYATVRNTGNASSSASTLRYYLSSDSTINTGDSEIGTDTVDALSAGATSPEDKGDRDAPNTPGTYWVGACVDSVSGESNTGNNCSIGVQITVSDPTYPDLVIQSPSVSDTTLTPGQSFTAYAAARNQGTATSASTTLRYYRSTDSTISTSDTQIATDSVSSLSPGGTSAQNATVTAPTTTGTYWIGACVDSVSGETNIGNNCSAGVQIATEQHLINIVPIIELLLQDN